MIRNVGQTPTCESSKLKLPALALEKTLGNYLRSRVRENPGVLNYPVPQIIKVRRPDVGKTRFTTVQPRKRR
jgi:hypothetical protein